MDVYKAKSVYKAPGIYRSGIYKDPSEVVLLNGVRYENRFYEIDSNNVGSTFVDAVRLPEGYEKLKRVWYNGSLGERYPSLIESDFQVPIQFGIIYLGAYAQAALVSNRIFTNKFTDSKLRYIRVLSTQLDKYVLTINSNRTGNTDIDRTASCALRDDNKFRISLVSDNTWYLAGPQAGNYQTDRSLTLLSSRGLVYFRFLFFVDRNRQVTFTAIPCKHGSDYGLYDMVAGKFYTQEDLTGD